MSPGIVFWILADNPSPPPPSSALQLLTGSSYYSGHKPNSTLPSPVYSSFWVCVGRVYNIGLRSACKYVQWSLHPLSQSLFQGSDICQTFLALPETEFSRTVMLIAWRDLLLDMSLHGYWEPTNKVILLCSHGHFECYNCIFIWKFVSPWHSVILKYIITFTAKNGIFPAYFIMPLTLILSLSSLLFSLSLFTSISIFS